MRPYDNTGDLETTGSHKKLRFLKGDICLGYNFDVCQTNLIYSYKNSNDHHEDYDSFNSNAISVVIPYKWTEDENFVTIFAASCEYQKYLGRFVSNITTNPKVHLTTYDVSVHPAWHIDENTLAQAKLSYKKRNTNVNSGTINREFSSLLCELSLNYIF
jgi:hypothetical protein